MGRRMMLGFFVIRSMASLSESGLSPMPRARKEGFLRSIRLLGLPPESRLISSGVSGCLASSRSANLTPFCESDAFALRHVVQVVFQ